MSNELATVEQSKLLAASSLVPDHLRGKPENVYLILLLGDSLGLHPAQALTSIAVIKGKPTMSAELMRAVVMNAGHRFRIDESTPTAARVTVARKEWPQDESQFAFTVEDAKRAGLGGDSYQKYPTAMLLARVTTMACRAMFADVIAGISYTPEEMEQTTVEVIREALPDQWQTPQQFPKQPAALSHKQLARIGHLLDELGFEGYEAQIGIVNAILEDAHLPKIKFLKNMPPRHASLVIEKLETSVTVEEFIDEIAETVVLEPEESE
jgi:hypothetical protein